MKDVKQLFRLKAMPWLALMLLVLLLAVYSKRVAPVAPQSCPGQERLITKPVDFDIESYTMRRLEALGALQPLQTFKFQDNKVPPEVSETIHQTSGLMVEDGFLKFQSIGNDPYFIFRGLQVPADEVSVITVRASFESARGLPVDQLTVYFATDRAPEFSEQRKLTAWVQTDGKLRTVLLFTGRVSEWQGTITSLKVDPVRTPNQEVAIHEIALLKITGNVDFYTLELPSTGVARTWVDQTLQNVVFSRLSSPVEWTLTLPCEPDFRAQVALPGMYRYLSWLPFHALMEVRDRSGEWTPVSQVSVDKSNSKNIFQGVNLKFPLDRWAGQRVTFRLRAVAAEEDSTSGGFVYWINPYVTSRRVSSKQPNIILISIDTLRADHLSLYGYPRRTSPHLDAWAEKGVLFNYAISQAPTTFTSHSSLFTSLYPSQHQAIINKSTRHGFHDPLSEGFITLAERLQEGGYITTGFTAGGFVSSEVNLDQGFDSWSQDHYFPFGQNLDKISVWLDRHASSRFFLFLHTYEVHDYANERKLDITRQRARTFYPLYRGKVLDKDFSFSKHAFGQFYKTRGLNHEDLRFLEAMYDGQILAVDEELGRLFEEISRRGLEEKTVVIVTADHGEEFDEHGSLYHNHSLYDEMIRVPLIIHYPKRLPQGHTITHQVRLVDIYPTILELAGLPVPEGLEGRSLLPLIHGQEDEPVRIAFSEEPERSLSGIRTPYAKLLFYRGGERLAYNLIKDPLEQYPDVSPPDLQQLIALHDQFTAKKGGYHLQVSGPRLDDCPIRITTDGRFFGVVPRSTELSDAVRATFSRIELTFSLKDGDVDGLFFLVHPPSASFKVEMCKGGGEEGDGVKVRFGANPPVRMGTQWSVSQEISAQLFRVGDSPLQDSTDFRADLAIWYLQTKPAAESDEAELSPERRDEFLRRLRSLGYLQ